MTHPRQADEERGKGMMKGRMKECGGALGLPVTCLIAVSVRGSACCVFTRMTSCYFSPPFPLLPSLCLSLLVGPYSEPFVQSPCCLCGTPSLGHLTLKYEKILLAVILSAKQIYKLAQETFGNTKIHETEHIFILEEIQENQAFIAT